MNESPFDTVCKDCYFAKYEGETQTDCKAGRLEKFRNAGIEVWDCEDQEKEFYVIKERICNYLRPLNWDGGDVPNIKVMMESFPTFSVLIYSDSSDSLNDIYETMASIDKLEHGAKRPQIRFILDNSQIKPSQLVKFMFDNYTDNGEPKYKFFIDSVFDNSFDEGVDLSVKQIKTQYYIPCRAGYIFDTNPFEMVDHFINEKMGRFLILNHPNFRVVQTKIHRLVNGNHEYSLLKKVEELAVEHKNEYLIKDYNEICSTISQ